MGSRSFASSLKFCLGTRMKFILASLFFVGCLHCEPLSVDVDIEEDGTRYKQKVEYDPVTKAVTYRVPSHNDVISSVNIIHAESNTMLTMFEDRNGKQCQIRSAPAGFEPEANALGAFAVSANKETLTPGRTSIIARGRSARGKGWHCWSRCRFSARALTSSRSSKSRSAKRSSGPRLCRLS